MPNNFPEKRDASTQVSEKDISDPKELRDAENIDNNLNEAIEHGCRSDSSEGSNGDKDEAPGNSTPDDGDPSSPDDVDPSQEKKKRNKKIIKMIAIGTAVTAGAVIAPFAVVGALGAAGFGTGGVVAGSIAAGAQSTFYGAATGGIFSVCQSVGAAGLGATGIATSATVGGGIMGGVSAGISRLFGRNRKPPPDGSSNGTNDKSTQT